MAASTLPVAIAEDIRRAEIRFTEVYEMPIHARLFSSDASGIASLLRYSSGRPARITDNTLRCSLSRAGDAGIGRATSEPSAAIAYAAARRSLPL